MTQPPPPWPGHPGHPGQIQPGQIQPAESWGDTAVRVVGGVFAVGGLGLWLLMTIMVLASLYSSDAASDPHGYGIVFGTILGVPAGIIGAAFLPLVLPRNRRARGYLIAVPSFLAVLALQFLAMYLS